MVAAPTYNIIDELKDEGDWEILEKYADSNLMMKIRSKLRELSMKIYCTLRDQDATYAGKPRKGKKR